MQSGVLCGCGLLRRYRCRRLKIFKGLKATKRIEEGIEVGSAAAKCLHSFLPDTKVLLANGKSKKIEDVDEGDELLATDPETGKTQSKKVIATILTKDDKHFTELTLQTGENQATIIATDTHPFWSADQKRWIDAGDIEPGTTLRTASGASIKVLQTRHYAKQQTTHDLTIDRIHTYYVLAGATPVLVHNCGEQIYEAGGKHGSEARGSSRGENSAEPQNGQGALGNSVQIKPTSPRRVGIDPSNGDSVILDRTNEIRCGCTTPDGTNEIFHGHVRTNLGKDPGMAKAQSSLRKRIKAGDIELP
ncbi:polymorphic toxin-type HINT domain-containing protein [Streptomyces sp. NPDC088726]|uniref:polymorphic toxin-type HINT domain-containing protein n=1 Tax=Streptomyces sp. NPDC088726 TaxID=3365874 RepID=UPI003803486A